MIPSNVKPITSLKEEELQTLSIRDLKDLICKNGGDYKGLLEKPEYINLAKSLRTSKLRIYPFVIIILTDESAETQESKDKIIAYLTETKYTPVIENDSNFQLQKGIAESMKLVKDNGLGLKITHQMLPSVSIEVLNYLDIEKSNFTSKVTLFVGHSDKYGMGKTRIEDLLGKAEKHCKSHFYGFIGCAVGNTRFSSLLFLSHKQQYRSFVFGGFDKKISIDKVTESQIIQGIPYFMHYFEKNKPNETQEIRRLIRLSFGMPLLNNIQGYGLFFNDSDEKTTVSEILNLISSELDENLQDLLQNFLQLSLFKIGKKSDNLISNFIEEYTKTDNKLQKIVEYLNKVDADYFQDIFQTLNEKVLDQNTVIQMSKEPWNNILNCESEISPEQFALALFHGYHGDVSRENIELILLTLNRRYPNDKHFIACALGTSENFLFSISDGLCYKLKSILYYEPKSIAINSSFDVNLLLEKNFVGHLVFMKPNNNFFELFVSNNPNETIELLDYESIAIFNDFPTPINRNKYQFSLAELRNIFIGYTTYLFKTCEVFPYEIKEFYNGNSGNHFQKSYFQFTEDKFLESRLFDKIGANIERCRLVYQYTEVDGYFKGPLYFTDVHYGNDLLLLGNQTLNGHHIKKHIEFINSQQKSSIDKAINMCQKRRIFPFSLVGLLTIKKDSYDLTQLACEQLYSWRQM